LQEIRESQSFTDLSQPADIWKKEIPFMRNKLKGLGALLLAVAATFAGAQTTAQAGDTPKPVHHATQLKKTPSVQQQIKAMHDELKAEMESQIDQLKQQLNDSIAQLQQAQQRAAAASSAAAQAQLQSEQQQQNTADNTAAVSSLHDAVAKLQVSHSGLDTQVQQVEKSMLENQKAIEQPAAIRYKGVTITPGGFLAGETVWRQRALNADMYTNWNGQPYPGSAQAFTSEFVPSARQSRLSFLVSGSPPIATLNGFFEGDFLSAGSTSNNLQSNSYTLRIRQAWAQASTKKNIFTGGQMWTLLTEDKAGATPGQEALPLFFDGNLHVGFTYARQPGLRYQRVFSPEFTLAASLENSQYQFSATNAPSNFFFGEPGSAAGLFNPSANYTNQVAPDVAVKAAFDPGYGHYEVAGIVRLFRDRYYPKAPSGAGAQNNTTTGGGFSVSARFPVTPKADFGVHLVGGDGTGRYGASLLPDVTVHPDGTLEPLRNAQGIVSLELHRTKRFDIFGYAGTEYVQRTYYAGADGKLVGYAPPTESNTGCFVEAAPTAGSGYAPGSGPCVGATRDLVQGSAGWVYRLYSGPIGRLQYGVAYTYIVRNGWAGVGGAPKATNNYVYTSFRYYVP
jgi:hypothetical protein